MIYAPFDGKVDVMFETGHAVGLVGENGVELLVHIGIDTVNLEGISHRRKQQEML